MNIVRAARLRALWNESFHLNLLIVEKPRDNYLLSVAKNTISPVSLAILERLSNRLNLDFRVGYAAYTIN